MQRSSCISPKAVTLHKAQSPTRCCTKYASRYIVSISKDWDAVVSLNNLCWYFTTHTVGKRFFMYKWKCLMEYLFRENLLLHDSLKFARIIIEKVFQMVNSYMKLVTWHERTSIKLVPLAFFIPIWHRKLLKNNCLWLSVADAHALTKIWLGLAKEPIKNQGFTAIKTWLCRFGSLACP